jgi:hypothetical protein
VPIVLKSGSLKLLEPSGTAQACNGITFRVPLPLLRIQTGNGGSLVSYSESTGTFVPDKMITLLKVDIHLHIVSRLRKSDALVLPSSCRKTYTFNFTNKTLQKPLPMPTTLISFPFYRFLPPTPE